MTLNEYLKSIADAIRAKKGTSAKIKPENFASEIEGITTGGGGLTNPQTFTITRNFYDAEWSSDSSVTSITEGSSHSEDILGAVLSSNTNVYIRMNGVNIKDTSMCVYDNKYEDGATIPLYHISIPYVTGNITILVTVFCCFVAGTKVWLCDGSVKNIEDVVVGDIIMTYNEETNVYENGEVRKLVVRENVTDMARVTLSDGTFIKMNAYHPIYTEEGWKSLTRHEGLPLLTERDKVLSANDKFIQISSIDRWVSEPTTMYTLDVEENDNFFVGDTPIMVHNAACPD